MFSVQWQLQTNNRPYYRWQELQGIGITTLIRRVASELSEYRLGGFYTGEIREAGQRKGFRLVTVYWSFQGMALWPCNDVNPLY